MKKTLELTLQQAQDIYKSADASVKEILEANFGKMNLIGRPLGVWCLTKDRKAVKAEDWNSKDVCIGVGVITEKTSFTVHLEPQAALPFGSTSVEEYDDIVYDEQTYDNDIATGCISSAHLDVKGNMWDDENSRLSEHRQQITASSRMEPCPPLPQQKKSQPTSRLSTRLC